MPIDIHITGARIKRLIAAMYGPGSVPPRPPEEDRWLNEGGALIHGEDGYDHVIVGPCAFVLELPIVATHAPADAAPIDLFDQGERGVRVKTVYEHEGRWRALVIFDVEDCEQCGRRVPAMLLRINGRVRPAWSCSCGRAWAIPQEKPTSTGAHGRWLLP